MGKVIVVGAGYCGLSAAWQLKKAGHDVIVLEAEDKVGGKTAGIEQNGVRTNSGATVLGGTYKAFRELARDVGVEDQIVKVPAKIGIFSEGQVHWLRGAGPGALVDFIKTPLLSGKSKLLLRHAGVDAMKARKKANYDRTDLRAELDVESVEEYCNRRLNPEIRDRLINPVMTGLFAADFSQASVADLHFILTKILGGGVLGYKKNIDFVARAVAERLDVRLSAHVDLVEEAEGKVRVRWTEGGETKEEIVDGAVLTVPAPFVPPMYPGLEPEIQGTLLEGVEQYPIYGLRIITKPRPDEDGMIVCAHSNELGPISTVMLEHIIAPEVAPADTGVIGVLFDGDWTTANREMSDEEIVEAALPELERVLPGVTEIIDRYELTRWDTAATRSDVGFHKRIAKVEEKMDDGRKIQLAGDYMTIASINGSVVSGANAARRLTGSLG